MRTPLPSIAGSLDEPILAHRRPELPGAQHLAPLVTLRMIAEPGAPRVPVLVERHDAYLLKRDLIEEVRRVAGAHDLYVRPRREDGSEAAHELGLGCAVECAVDVVHEDKPWAFWLAERRQEPEGEHRSLAEKIRRYRPAVPHVEQESVPHDLLV